MNINYQCSDTFYEGIKELTVLGLSFEACRGSLTIQVALYPAGGFKS
jgi:hypothetical protein